MKKDNFFKRNWLVMLCGLLVGTAAVVLTELGNPANMGFCIACFLRDIAGSLQLHQNGAVQYFRPEIIGLIIGACIIAFVGKEFKPRGGSSPFTRLILGAVVMMGALVFLGCPLRMVIRIGGGDLNAIIGLVGFMVGILIGIVFLKGGFSLGRTHKQSMIEGLAFPVVMAGLFVLSLMSSYFIKATADTGKPGGQQAVWYVALGIALVVGILAQRSRLCMVGGLRDAVMFKEFGLLAGFGGILIAVLVGNAILGNLHWGFVDQKVSHNDFLWNFTGMVVVGWGSVLLGGCPLRQLILAGEGNTDSALTVFGMIGGAALAHTWDIAGKAGNVAPGGTAAGSRTMVAMIGSIIILLLVSLFNTKKEKA